MAPPTEIEALRELVDVSQLTGAFQVDSDNDDDSNTAFTTNNKRCTTTNDDEADELEDEELQATPRAPKKPRPVTAVSLLAKRQSDMSSHSSAQLDGSLSVSSLANVSGVPSCADNWVKKGNAPGVLLTMCIGLKSQKNPAFGIVSDDPNYKDRTNKTKFKPTKVMLMEEVKRRYRIYHGATKDKKCLSYTVPQLISFLLAHPIIDADEVAYLEAEEAKFRIGLDAAQKERAELSELHSTDDPWVGDAPWLRLYHVMITDRVQLAYKDVNTWESRAGIDARNSNMKPPSFYEIAAERYNSPAFAVKSYAYPHLHENFATRIDLSVGPTIPHVTADKIKKKLSDARAKLIKLIADWEKSGNGCGQRNEEGSSFGHIAQDQLWINVSPDAGDDSSEFMDGDNRASFLGTRRPHLLYMWELFDKHDLLDQTLNKLADSCSASEEFTPSATGLNKATLDKKTASAKRGIDVLQVQESTALAMKMIADSQSKSQLLAMENTLMHLQDRLMSETVQQNESFRHDFEQQVQRVKKQIDEFYGKKVDLSDK